MVLIIFASYDTRQPSAWRQTHEAQTGATCANKRGKRTRRKQVQHVRTNATGANMRKQTHEAQTGETCANKRNKRTRPKQVQATKPTRPKQAQASPTKRKQAQTRQEQYQNLRTVWRKTP